MMITTILLIINFILLIIEKPLLFGFINFIWMYPVEIAIYILLVLTLTKIGNKFIGK